MGRRMHTTRKVEPPEPNRMDMLRAIAFIAVTLPTIAITSAGLARAEAGGTSRPYAPLYGELLKQYAHASKSVVQIRIDYAALRKDARWRQLISALEATDPSRMRTRRERLAYWINAYNIFAIELVQRAYPIDSIKDVGSFLFPVWKADAGKIAGRIYSLDEIEHQILRPMRDPRVHGAIVCASISCPPLQRVPFEAERIDELLDDAMR
jgi:hypothetical protein